MANSKIPQKIRFFKETSRDLEIHRDIIERLAIHMMQVDPTQRNQELLNGVDHALRVLFAQTDFIRNENLRGHSFEDVTLLR